jgi:MFS family permease
MSGRLTTPVPLHRSVPEPITPPLAWRWRLDTFRALRHRNYRLYFLGQGISLTGSWLQSAALSWLAYDMTHQSRWPALVGAAQVLPTFVLGAWGGGLADRIAKRPLIFTCQAALLVLAVLLAGVVAFGVAGPWTLLAIALACGIVNAVDLPARLSFVIEMVGRDDLVNAVALNSMLFNAARAIGPAVSAALLPTLGPALCFFVNGLSFVAVLAALAAMHLPPRSAPKPTSSCGTRGTLRSALVYLSHRPKLVLLLVLSGAMSFFGWPILPLLPAVSDRQLGLGNAAYAVLLSALGCGALVAALGVATFGNRLRRGWFLGGGVVLAAGGMAALGQCRQLAPALACSTLAGAGLIFFFASSQAVMQLGSADHNRGRVMGIWSMVLSGAHPLGQFTAGLAADQWGVAPVLATAGLGISTAAALVGLLWCLRVVRPAVDKL